MKHRLTCHSAFLRGRSPGQSLSPQRWSDTARSPAWGRGSQCLGIALQTGPILQLLGLLFSRGLSSTSLPHTYSLGDPALCPTKPSGLFSGKGTWGGLIPNRWLLKGVVKPFLWQLPPAFLRHSPLDCHCHLPPDLWCRKCPHGSSLPVQTWGVSEWDRTMDKDSDLRRATLDFLYRTTEVLLWSIVALLFICIERQ